MQEPSPKLVILFNLDLSLRPLSSRYSPFEQNIDLAIGTILHLRQLEVCRDQTQQSRSTPYVAAFASHYRRLANPLKVETQDNGNNVLFP